MIDQFISKLLSRWVSLAEKSPIITLLILAIFTVFTSHYTANNFAINSDLDRLVKPTKVIEWYQNDREWRSTFPQYQQNALIVISSDNAEATFLAAEKLFHALNDSKKFADVFSPAFDAFASAHALYGAPTEGVRYLANKVQDNLSTLENLQQAPSMENFLQHMQNTFSESADMEVLLPETSYQFEVLTETIKALGQPVIPSLKMIKKLAPQDEGDTSYHFITVKSHEDFTQSLPQAVTVQNIRDVVANAHLGSNIKVRITGEVALANDEISEGLEGVRVAGLISIGLLAIILTLGFGFGWHSLFTISGIFIMLFVGVSWTTFFALLVMGSFNTLSLIFLVMFFGLGVDFAVHYVLRVEEYAYAPEKSASSAAVAAATDVGIPLLLCVLTTAVGFLSFWPTAYVGLAELGVISAIGMLLAFIVTLTFFPAWLKLFGISTGKLLPQEPHNNIAIRFGRFLSSKLTFTPRMVLFITIMLAVSAVWYEKDLRFNYSHLAMRDKTSEAMTTLFEIQKNQITNDYSIVVMTHPDMDLHAFKEKLLTLPSVAKVDLPEDYIPSFQEAKYSYMKPVAERLAALPVSEPIKELNKEEVQKTIESFLTAIDANESVFLDEDLLVIQRLQAALSNLLQKPQYWPSFQQAVFQGVNADVAVLTQWFSAKPFTLNDLPDDLKNRFMTKDGKQLVNVIPALNMSDIRQMDQFIAEVNSVSPNIAGRTVIEWGIGNIVLECFREAATIAFICIFILLWLNFRSVSTVILVFIPLLLATIFTFAIAKYFGITLNMANILVVPLIFGLGVDMGIHVVDRYRKSTSVEDMMVSGTTRAVIISGLTTVGTFFSLSFSPHKGAASIGFLLSIAITLLLLVTYIVLPALLSIFQSKKQAESLN